MGVPVVGFLLGAAAKEAGEVGRSGTGRPVSGPVRPRLATFTNPLGQPWDGKAAHTGVYVRYLGHDDKRREQFVIFAMNCAHLGCPVSWFPQSGLFMCPCHGGVYYANGERASGPPPRGLLPVRLAIQGRPSCRSRRRTIPLLQDTLASPEDRS